MEEPPSPETLVPVEVDRRRFLTWLVAAPTLVVAARMGLDVSPAHAEPPPGSAAFDLYLSLRSDGRVSATLPRTEMGQGITTGVAMLVAEELETPLDTVDVHTADADPRWLIQLTGLSTTMRYLSGPLRAAAASARARLVTAAAHRWRLPAHGLTTAQGEVRAPDGRRAGDGELAQEAGGGCAPRGSPRRRVRCEPRTAAGPGMANWPRRRRACCCRRFRPCPRHRLHIRWSASPPGASTRTTSSPARPATPSTWTSPVRCPRWWPGRPRCAARSRSMMPRRPSGFRAWWAWSPCPRAWRWQPRTSPGRSPRAMPSG